MTVAAMLVDDRYWLDEQIGAGGFCEVWRATDTVLTRPVAVKMLHAGYAQQPEAQARFKAEARHAGALSHENIARVYDYGEPALGQSYLVMELLAGPTLDGVLASGPLDAARTMDIIAQIATGLQAAHSAGLIHRDIKPSNIMFTSDGTVRITDFGVAHAVGSVPLTATGMVVGSPGYIAPERVAGAQAGPASDLYGLGVVAFECLAGARPFTGTPLEVAIAHRDRPLPPLPAWVPADVAAMVMTLTAKDPSRRPASAGEVARQARLLRDTAAAGAIGAPRQIQDAALTQTRTDRARPRARGAAVAVLAALACLVLLPVTGFALAAHLTARPSSGPAQAAKPATRAASATTRPAGQQPSATPRARTSVAATVRHTPTPHLTPQPGAPGGEDGPGGGNGHAKGHGNGAAHGNGRGAGHGNGHGTAVAAGGGS